MSAPNTKYEFLPDQTKVVFGRTLRRIRALISFGVVAKGDIVVLTAGEQVNMPGATNTLKIVRVGERNAQPALRH